jgi:hypothetical protein
LAPEGQWSGCEDEELVIKGMPDTTYGSDYDTRHSIMGWATFLNSAPIIVKSKMRQYVDLSVTESELGGVTEMAQDMLFAIQILESMGLHVKKPMILYLDKEGAKDLAKNWSVGGQTWHVEVCQYSLHKFKEQNLIHCVWTSSATMSSDVLTKNLPQDIFNHHDKVFSGEDQYMKKKTKGGNLQVDEDVGGWMTPKWYMEVPAVIEGTAKCHCK